MNFSFAFALEKAAERKKEVQHKINKESKEKNYNSNEYTQKIFQ